MQSLFVCLFMRIRLKLEPVSIFIDMGMNSDPPPEQMVLILDRLSLLHGVYSLCRSAFRIDIRSYFDMSVSV